MLQSHDGPEVNYETTSINNVIGPYYYRPIGEGSFLLFPSQQLYTVTDTELKLQNLMYMLITTSSTIEARLLSLLQKCRAEAVSVMTLLNMMVRLALSDSSLLGTVMCPASFPHHSQI